MALWFVLAMMTALAIFAVLWPLGRPGRAGSGGTESAVYKDQLAEVARDKTAGLIAPEEAEAARVEIARRLLAADDAERIVSPRVHRGWRRAVALVALLGMPVMAGALYLAVGAPQLPDQPLTAR